MSGTSNRLRRNAKKRRAGGQVGGAAGTSSPNTSERVSAHSFGDLMRYRFDNVIARGAVAMIGLLFLGSAVIVFVAAAVIRLFHFHSVSGGTSFLGILYYSLIHALDTGTIGNDQGSNPWFLAVMVMVTLGGIFVVSSLIGIITTSMDRKMDQLRRGRSMVLEQGHSLILGWSPQVFAIISELVVANENQKKSCVVILGDEDKVTMEDEIHSRVPDTKRTKVVCRSGSCLDPVDLSIVSPQTARSVIIVSPQTDDPDAHVIKTLLALTNHPDGARPTSHIVASVREKRNLEVARMVGRDDVELILASDLIARITVQTCRQAGLSAVYQELLDFEGDEIYFAEEPGLIGRSFGEALLAFETSTLIGLRTAAGVTQIKPAMNTVIAAGDQLIAISEDDDTIQLSASRPASAAGTSTAGQVSIQESPERTLVLGWNKHAANLLRELDNYVPPGSMTVVATSTPDIEGSLSGVKAGLRSYTLEARMVDTADRTDLDALDTPSFDQLIVLSYSDEYEAHQADARTLMTLLHLRDIQEKTGATFSIVSEMQDVRNRELAEVTRADDFVVSDQLVSLLMTQLSENRHLGPVFKDLFDAEGSEIYLKPAEHYVELNRPVDFYAVTQAAQSRDEIAIGFRHQSQNGHDRSDVVVNPNKSEEISFSPGDRIVVIAEDSS